jgi:uncharacterized protein (TIGR02145 family)
VLTSGVALPSFAWSCVPSSVEVGGCTAGTGNAISQVLTNSGFDAETAMYTVSPSANGCPGIPNTVTVTINPLPATAFPVCLDPVVTNTTKPVVLKGGTPPGGTYSGPGVALGIFDPSLAGLGNLTLTYSYTNVYGCVQSATHPITVIATPFFSCGNLLTDVRDGKTYPTVGIGGQCWMAANLDYGTVQPAATDQTDNCLPEKYCFGNNPANCGTSGGMYQWDEAMGYSPLPGSRGLCPPDWHVPTENEWQSLFLQYISNGFAGNPLKYTGFSNFNALLSGVRFNDVVWDFNNFAVFFWSSTPIGTHKAWAHGMNTFNPSVSYYPSLRNNSFPVRCIKD